MGRRHQTTICRTPHYTNLGSKRDFGVMAFHEKAGRSQVDSCLFLLGMLFSSRRVATVAMLPSALSSCLP